MYFSLNEFRQALYFLILALLLILSAVDIRKRRVPTELILAGACFFYLYIFIIWNREGYIKARAEFIEGVIGAVVLFALTFAASFLGGALLKRNALGGGDIRLFALLGLCLGMEKGLYIVLLTCGISILAFPALKKAASGGKFPLVPCISAAAFLVMII